MNRRGVSIQLVLVCGLIGGLALLAAMEWAREPVTDPPLARLQARLAATAGMQHALLKLRLLKKDAYAAAALYRGQCPFVPVGVAASVGRPAREPLSVFRQDLKSTDAAAITNTWAGLSGLSYEVALTPRMADQRRDERVTALSITATGRVRTALGGTPVQLKQDLEQTVEIGP